MYANLSALVNVLREGSQLQSMKTLKVSPTASLLALHLYPEPGDLVFGLDQGRLRVETQRPPKGLKPFPSPLQLYLRAHFSNARVLRARFEDESQTLLVNFAPSNAEVRMSAHGADLEVRLAVPGRKEFLTRLKLGSFPKAAEASLEVASADSLAAESVAPQSDRRSRRLATRVTGDLEQAQEWLRKYGALLEAAAQDPGKFGGASFFSADWGDADRAEAVRELRLTGKNLSQLFVMRRRMERKAASAGKRLAQVLSGAEVSRARGSALSQQKRARDEAGSLLDSGPNSSPDEARLQSPKKRPGIWIKAAALDVYFRVGRSAEENAELFRQASSRDLWFHVRGLPGGHVWLPRGQEGFGAKSEAGDALLAFGAKLALVNAPGRLREAVVDYTERRYLRAVSGREGLLRIERSQTRFVRRDPEFDRMLNDK